LFLTLAETTGEAGWATGCEQPSHFQEHALIIVRIQQRTLVIQEEVGAERRMDRLEWERCLAEVEAIGEVIRRTDAGVAGILPADQEGSDVASGC